MIFLLLCSVGLGVTAPSLLDAWFCMEMAMMFFLLVAQGFSPLPILVKLFLIQSMSSMLLLMGFGLAMSPVGREGGGSFCAIAALALKLGLPPFQSWVLGMVETFRWPEVFLLLVPLKVVPLFIWVSLVLAQGPGLESGDHLTWVAAGVSLLVGGGLAPLAGRLEEMVVYSSILSMGFFLSLVSVGGGYWLMFLGVYSLQLFLLVYALSSGGESEVAISLLGVSGFPPLLSFLNKWLALGSATSAAGFGLLPFAMCASSVPSLFMYSRFLLGTIFTPTPSVGGMGELVPLWGNLVIPWLIFMDWVAP